MILEMEGHVSNFCKAVFILVAGLCATNAVAQSQYPLVFDSVNELKRYGLALTGIGSSKESDHFRNRCYFYGDGGWYISISDALLNIYKAQGFSRRSACLALVSGIRFNPETGKRLATYVLVDREMLKRPLFGEEDNFDTGTASDELPLSLPKCFSRGLPYSDCAWNYDPMSGKKLAANATAENPNMWADCRRDSRTREFCETRWTAKEAGSRIEQFLGNPKTRCESAELVISCIFEGRTDPAPSNEIKLEQSMIFYHSRATLYDHSPEFPKGYGYALFASGEAGPGVDAEAVKAALNGKKPPAQVDAKRLKEIWGTGTK
jgi:hypothetical protein